jgi:hypothetical protein
MPETQILSYTNSFLRTLLCLRSLDRLIVNIMNLTGCLNKDLTKAFSVLESETQIQLLGHNYRSKIYRRKHSTRDSRMSRQRCSKLKLTVTSDADPVASRSKEWVCCRSPVGIASSNPAGCMDIYLLQILYALSGRGLCDGPITRSEESYRV